MRIPLYHLDAFSAKAFGGNPAAVCPLPSWIDDHLMQSIAAENNLAETAFFALIDPMELHIFAEHVGFSRLAVYSGGFFVFWAFAAASSALTCFLQRTAEEINLKKEDTNAAC